MAERTKFEIDELADAHEFAVDFWKQLGIPATGGSLRDEAVRTHFDRLRRLTIVHGDIMTAAPTIKERGDWCYHEATRDVIFILQSARKHWSEDDCRLKHMAEAEAEGNDDHEWEPCDTCWTEWRPEGVWLSRKEAEEYGEARAYRWKDGWRVYGLCAEGELAKLLKTICVGAGADFKGKPKRKA